MCAVWESQIMLRRNFVRPTYAFDTGASVSTYGAFVSGDKERRMVNDRSR